MLSRHAVLSCESLATFFNTDLPPRALFLMLILASVDFSVGNEAKAGSASEVGRTDVWNSRSVGSGGFRHPFLRGKMWTTSRRAGSPDTTFAAGKARRRRGHSSNSVRRVMPGRLLSCRRREESTPLIRDRQQGCCRVLGGLSKLRGTGYWEVRSTA